MLEWEIHALTLLPPRVLGPAIAMRDLLLLKSRQVAVETLTHQRELTVVARLSKCQRRWSLELKTRGRRRGSCLW